VEEVKKIILDEFAKVSENLGEEELNRTKEQIIGNYQISMEDSQEQLMNLLGYEIEGNAAKFYELEKNIRNATLNEVKNLAKLGKYSFFALMPE
jgi:predicted Zn-dependent peptidase